MLVGAKNDPVIPPVWRLCGGPKFLIHELASTIGVNDGNCATVIDSGASHTG